MAFLSVATVTHFSMISDAYYLPSLTGRFYFRLAIHHILTKSYHASSNHISQLSYDGSTLDFGRSESKELEAPLSPSGFFASNNSFQTPTRGSNTAPGKIPYFFFILFHFVLRCLFFEATDLICAT